jgi:putative endonuclease
MELRHCTAYTTIRSMQTEKTWWLYLLACRNGRTYTGIALDVNARFELHRSGKGAKFTRANPPRKILAVQPFTSRSEALKAEYALKQLDRAKKLAWARRLRDPASAATT